MITLRVAMEVRDREERGRYAATLIRQKRQIIADLPEISLAELSSISFSDEDLGLQRWLVKKGLGRQPTEETPSVLLTELRDRLRGRILSAGMRRSMQIWEETLENWRRSSRSREEGGDLSQHWLGQARRAHFEAAGLESAGRSYDATALRIWSSFLLSRFIEENTSSPDLPEAIFLLGTSYLSFRHALPAGSRLDQILGLCPDFFPGTVWAERARLIWRKEMRPVRQNLFPLPALFKVQVEENV